MAQRHEHDSSTVPQNVSVPPVKSKITLSRFFSFAAKNKLRDDGTSSSSSDSTLDKKVAAASVTKSTWGILADKETDQVPGTVRLLSHSDRNAPLGEDKAEHPMCDAASTTSRESRPYRPESAKRTRDGKIVLQPQPEDSPNDPLNWPAWRRDIALLCLGFYCMLGGGMTPVLAAGFNQVAETYQVSFSKVALTTGLYMMGLGVGSVVFSPTAFLFGKRTVYLISSILFVLSSVWCALAPNYANLVVARIFQGIAVSPVECLPSATIAEIFFLHERAFRIGVYTLLLLGGKNLIPLASAAIIEAKGWRWVFWVVAIVVGCSGISLVFFVPETTWDRTPRRRKLKRNKTSHASLRSHLSSSLRRSNVSALVGRRRSQATARSPQTVNGEQGLWVDTTTPTLGQNMPFSGVLKSSDVQSPGSVTSVRFAPDIATIRRGHPSESGGCFDSEKADDPERADALPADDANTLTKPASHSDKSAATAEPADTTGPTDLRSPTDGPADARLVQYTAVLRSSPPVSYLQTLRPWTGRVSDAKWHKVCIRPFILYAYPAVLWSSVVYALSVGWLIVLSESVAHIYETRDSYNFSSIQVGLVYLAPFIGGVLGTAVAGRLSDVIVRWMARRNDGIYEPEYRLVMAIPITICTAIGLMGFGWSAEEKDNFMVPTVFFGIISFGCCMGSTTAITFCVDSYRQFASEALVTLNFSKNVLHGLVWSLFFPQWLVASGSKTVFLAIGGIQIACLLSTIPMYIYGKRARMWTVRARMMERF